MELMLFYMVLNFGDYLTPLKGSGDLTLPSFSILNSELSERNRILLFVYVDASKL